jgi:putative SOS response-associated peptidase YedK
MPVILPRTAWATWLDPRPADLGELHALLVPSEEPLEIYPVVGLVNNVRNDGPELVEPLVTGPTEAVTPLA